MAFSKMAGLDVSPEMPSSWIMRRRSPERMCPRRMLSSQMDCPRDLRASSGFEDMSPPFFDRVVDAGASACAPFGKGRPHVPDGLYDGFGREPQLAVERRGGGRGPESVEAHDGAVQAHIGLPAERGPRLDRHPTGDPGGQDVFAI